MQWTEQEERQILDGLKTFVDIFSRSISEQSKKQEQTHHQASSSEAKEVESKNPTPPVKPSTARASTPHLIPVMKWNDHHEYPSVGSLRWLIFNGQKTGFDKVIRRVGRRVLIDEAAFFEWVGSEKLPGRS